MRPCAFSCTTFCRGAPRPRGPQVIWEPTAIFSHMARGRRWSQSDVEQWVERWWASGLTSVCFVKTESLPISARSLRSYAERHFGEVQDELKELRSLAAANGLSWSRSLPVTGHMAKFGEVPEAAETLDAPIEANPQAGRFIFDLDEDEVPDEPPEAETVVEREVAARVSGRQVASTPSPAPPPRTHPAAPSGEVGQVATADAGLRHPGPFLFDVEVDET